MMSHAEYHVRCSTYEAVLERVEELNTYMIILDRPRIALPARARMLVQEMKDLLPILKLRRSDLLAIKGYVLDAESFCKCFFQPGSPVDQPAVLPLRLPCDSGRLLRNHEALYQKYTKLHSRLRMAL